MASGKRTIFAYESKLMTLDRTGNQVSLRWRPDFIEEVFRSIMAFSVPDRVIDKRDEWFFFLSNLTIDKRPKEPPHENCIYGWFEGVKIGFRTDLRKRSTMGSRPNPKDPDESETHKTYFYMRLRDGLLLLDNYKENVVTAKRLETYLKEKAKNVFESNGVQFISFNHLISRGFLEELGRFSVIRLARIRLKVTPNEEYNTRDGIGYLQEASRATYANYLDIVIGKKNARKHGLHVGMLRNFLESILGRRDQVISGTIEGTRSDSGSPILKLHGIEEKHTKTFEKDPQGEILAEPIIEYMIDLGNNHS